MRVFCIACLLVVSSFLVAQQAPDPASAPPAPAAAQPPAPAENNSAANGAPAVPDDLQQVVARQFGPGFKVAKQRQSTAHYLHQPEHAAFNTLLVGDLDGDGVEDAVIVARAKNVFSGQIPFEYSVSDPYFSAFGYGNPRITAGMAEEYPEGNYVVLIIHGAGPEGWRAPKPKSKFVLINLPFNTINVAPIFLDKKHKSKQVTAIILEEDGTNQSSLVAWDGKKYRWRDLGGPGE